MSTEEKSEDQIQQEQQLREQLNADIDRDLPDKVEEKGTQQVIDSFKDRWNINDDNEYYVTDRKKKAKAFPRDAEIGDTWDDPETGKTYKKTGDSSWTQEGKKNYFNMRECGECNRYLRNPNEVRVNLSTGKCFKCHAREEKKKIANGEEYDPPAWKKEIRFTDTYGNVVMNIDELIEEYGELVAHGVLTQLVGGMDKMRDEGKRVNEAMYQNALDYIERLEESVGKIDHSKLKQEMLKVKSDLRNKKNQKLKKQYDLSEK